MLQIGSREIYEDLLQLGLTPNKEFRLSLPAVPGKYLRHFVRGFFDGDGYVSYGYYKRKNRRSRIFVLMVRFASASKKFLQNLSQRVSLITDIEEGYISRNGTNFHLTYAKASSIKLYRYFYEQVPKECFLERKYNKFREALRVIGAVA